MRRIYLRDCAPGDIVDDVFVVQGKQFSAGSNGKQFIKALVSDRSCQVTARLWNATRQQFDALPEGFAHLRAKVETYQGNLQIILEQFWPAKEGSYDIGDLLPHTTKDIKQMCLKLAEILGSIQNRYLAALMHTYLDDEKLMADFCRAPAAMNMHHAFIGGLLEHTLNAIEVADAIAKFYPGLNRDLVVAGIFLHDIAKTWELSYATAFSYTDGGQLVGHIVKSAMWVEHKAKEAEAILGEPIPVPLLDVLQHIIISHHGVPEFGAIKPPSTPEAIAVHMIENMDAKLMMALTATRGEGITGDGNWTEYQKAFGGKLYRPDVATDEPTEPMPQQAAMAPIQKPVVEQPVEPATLRITNPLFEVVSAKRK
ncbi:MAG TPA: HD domain-containing protein [Humisphaera sp.]|jgi:3'-5' exoribonuclease|nr:HD domain-containing protein [Humisphaera sp.]